MSSEDNTSRKNIALIGHCGPDAWMLKSMVRRALDGAEVVMINSRGDLDSSIERLDLLLVNRVLDGDFENESGLDLISSIAESAGELKPAAILISNYEDAQAAAEQAGAKPGFGKSDLHSEEAANRLRAALD